MAYYFVCTTQGCSRNKPRYYVRATTVESRGDRCEECGGRMVRRQRPLKGPNTKQRFGKALRWRGSITGASSKPTQRKTNGKRIRRKGL
jgi:hypothetical protein